MRSVFGPTPINTRNPGYLMTPVMKHARKEATNPKSITYFVPLLFIRYRIRLQIFNLRHHLKRALIRGSKATLFAPSAPESHAGQILTALISRSKRVTPGPVILMAVFPCSRPKAIGENALSIKKELLCPRKRANSIFISLPGPRRRRGDRFKIEHLESVPFSPFWGT